MMSDFVLFPTGLYMTPGDLKPIEDTVGYEICRGKRI